jgi:outer membrane protein TolC
MGTRWVFYGLAFCITSATAQLEREPDKSYGLSTLSQQAFLQLLIQRSVEVEYSKIAADVSSHLMQGEAGLYEPNLFMNLRNEGRDRQRTADERIQNNATANTATLDESGQSKELGIRGRLPWGTELAVSYKTSKKSNNLIPQYNSSKYDTEFNTLLSVTIKQPLLRNAGQNVTETDLRVATLERDAAILKLRQQILKTSIEGLSDYWQLYRAEATLALRRSAHISAGLLLADAEARIKAGKLPSSAVLDVRAVLLNRQAEVTRSEQALREAQGKIATALNIFLGSSPAPSTQPVLQPSTKLLDSPPQSSESALSMWHPYLVAKLNYQQARLRLDYARNQMTPAVDLVFGYSGTGYNYDPKAARSVSERGVYPDWYIGVNVELPLQNNRKAHHQFLAQNSRLTQAELELSAISKSFSNDLIIKYDDLIQARNVLKISEEEVVIRQKALLNESLRFELGVGLLGALIQKQSDLTDSKQRLLENQIRFEVALATWKYIEGTLLGDYQVEIVGQVFSQK